MGQSNCNLKYLIISRSGKSLLSSKEDQMVSIVNSIMTKYVGLSTDTKPTEEIDNGSSFYEMDTGATYYFDADSETWITAD